MDKLEEDLFNRWKLGRDNFCPDGLIECQEYLRSNLKLMFILKEVNSSECFDLRKFVREGGRSQTWNNIARWIYGLKNIDREISWDEYSSINSNSQRIDLLKSIIAINIKKSPGSHTTNVQELYKIAKEDAQFLNQQFQIYYSDEVVRPDFIIACGTDASDNFNTLVEIKNSGEWQITSRGINYYEYSSDKYFIKYAHPEARVSDNFLIYPLVDAVKEILQKNGA